MKICLLLCLVTLTGFQYVHSAGLTCATDKQLKDITNLIAMWTPDSVAKNNKIDTMYTFKGTNTKQEYRLDSERPTADSFGKFRIQSGSETYADVLVKIGIQFGKRKIRDAFVNSARNCRIVNLETLALYSLASAENDEIFETILDEDIQDLQDQQNEQEQLNDDKQVN